MKSLIVLATSAVVLTANLAVAAALPPWARAVATADAAADQAPAVVLLDQTDVTITPDGKVRTTRRYVVRVRERAGRAAAALREVYVTESGRVRAIRGWLMRGGGEVRELGNRDVVDVALVGNDVYNEVRVRRIGAGDEVAPGDVFAAESESDERLLMSQIEWQMQDRWPTRLSRRTLTLPGDWRASAVMFNGPPLEARREGAALVWELTNLPALPDEAAMPPDTDLAPRLAISFFAPAPLRTPGQFETWSDVSAWLHGLSDAASRGSEAVAAKARELTAPATADLERVAAIARYTQRVQYISIQTGLGRGGGYQPRPAALVLERNYGDCKDKASLMRAMLGAIGIDSYLVSVYSGDRNYVRAEWPSPQQFNHAILAVSLTDLPREVKSAVDHPDLGRLVLFDPTDEHTPFGELPLDEQGSLGLVVHATRGQLLRLPATPVSAHALRRTTEGVIDASGRLTATVEEHFTGSLAADARARHAVLDAASYRTSIERRLASALPRAQVLTVAAADAAAEPGFLVTTRVEATGYARMNDRLVLFAPPFELDVRAAVPSAKDRKTAVVLEPRSITETVRLRLPEGFAVDEHPPAAAFETPFGRYTLEYSTAPGHLVATRTLETPLQTIRPDQLATARTFFEQVRAADSALVVVVRK